MTVSPALPEIDGEACVHALAAQASCRACIGACPHQALVMDDEALGIDTGACTGCGACVPACPRGAITLDRPVTVIEQGPGRALAFAACRRIAEPPVAPMPCIHALGVRDLDAMAADGVRTLSILTGACTSCPDRASGIDLAGACARHQAVRGDRGAPSVALAMLSGRDFSRTLARARQDADPVDRSRRRLFAVLTVPATEAQARVAEPRAYVTPTIDPARCSGCDACFRLCPDGALELDRSGPAVYRVHADRCTGCGLCVDVCEDGAIETVNMGPARVPELSLSDFRCRACGVAVHRPLSEAGTAGTLCRICARTGHYKSLYQVFDA